MRNKEFFSFLEKQLEQYAEGQLQGEISRIPGHMGATNWDPVVMVRGGQ